jgi:hypothetical protein
MCIYRELRRAPQGPKRRLRGGSGPGRGNCRLVDALGCRSAEGDTGNGRPIATVIAANDGPLAESAGCRLEAAT